MEDAFILILLIANYFIGVATGYNMSSRKNIRKRSGK